MDACDDIRANDFNRPFTDEVTLNSAVGFSAPLLAGRKKLTTAMKILIILLLLLQTQSALSLDSNSVLSTEIFRYHNETATKAEFAFEVVDKIFNAFSQWFFTITFCDFTYFENRIIKYTETHGYGYPVMLINSCPDGNKTKVKPKLNKHGQTAYLVTSSELNLEGSDFTIEALQRTGVFKPRSTVIFIIIEPVNADRYFYYTLKLHFQLLWSRSITNSVLILRADKLRIYTYNPFFDEIRDVTEVEDLSHVLCQQYHNLYGYKLRLSVFRKIYVSDETGPVLCDSKLAKTVMSFLNASCVPLVPRDGSTVGDLLDNGTATGVTADLMDAYSDLELNSRILKNSYYGYIDTTYPLTQDELCFLIKNSPKQSTFTSTVKSLSLPLLTIFFAVVIIFILLSIFVLKTESELLNSRHKQSAGAIAMDLIKCFIRQTVDIKFWGPVFRFLTMMVVLYSVIVDCIIDGVIFSAIQYPRYKPDLNTLSELVDTNLTVAVHNRDLKLFVRSLNPEHYKALENRVEIVSDQKIKDIIEKRQFQYAILLRKSDAVYVSKKLANLHNGRGLFYVMQDCPVPCSIVYGLRYGSPYLIRINYILSHLNQGGITKHWTESEEYSLQRKISTNDKPQKPLDMTTLQEVFYVLFIGLLVSTVVFFLELTLYIYRQRLGKLFWQKPNSLK